jgi:glycosyltransferase involved in cell wall biosynthesis
MKTISRISVIIPLLNEEENLAPLYQRLTQVLAALPYAYEIVFVDDGSSDGSLRILTGLHAQDPDHVRIVEFRRNFGKTAALVAGFQVANGDVLITMDADLQDDPDEIPGMLAELEQGNDLVAAWRVERMDNQQKRLSSRIFNWVVSRVAGRHFHDLNCGFKVYRREVIDSVRLYSDLHRYIPVLAVWQGFRVVEKPVTHHPRHAGESKYGPGRVARGFMDLIMVLFVTKYLRHPLRLFGWLGVAVLSGGAVINFYLGVLWLIRSLNLADIPPIGTRPLLAVGVLAMILGVQLISLGLLGEMMRYFAYRPEEEYTIRRLW